MHKCFNPISSNEHPGSRIQHQISRIQHPVFNIRNSFCCFYRLYANFE